MILPISNSAGIVSTLTTLDVKGANRSTMLEEITNKLEEASISEDHKARMKFESRESTRAVQAWKAHLARSVTQEEAKQDALSQLDDETCLIVVDWAMKYLPQRYREQMSEFFGKRGRSWHVSAVITHLHNEESMKSSALCISSTIAIKTALQ